MAIVIITLSPFLGNHLSRHSSFLLPRETVILIHKNFFTKEENSMIHTTEMGNRIKEHRQLLGLTREEIAEKLDITPRFYYDLELGLKGMSLTTLCKICSTLNISSDYILFGDNLEEEGLDEYLSLFKQCPKEKRSYLKKISSEFVNAVQNADKNDKLD